LALELGISITNLKRRRKGNENEHIETIYHYGTCGDYPDRSGSSFCSQRDGRISISMCGWFIDHPDYLYLGRN
jgi:hypothetical protein